MSERRIDSLEYPLSITKIQERFSVMGARFHWLVTTNQHISQGEAMSKWIADPNGQMFHQRVHYHPDKDEKPIGIKDGIPYKWISISRRKAEELKLINEQ